MSTNQNQASLTWTCCRNVVSPEVRWPECCVSDLSCSGWGPCPRPTSHHLVSTPHVARDLPPPCRPVSETDPGGRVPHSPSPPPPHQWWPQACCSAQQSPMFGHCTMWDCSGSQLCTCTCLDQSEVSIMLCQPIRTQHLPASLLSSLSILSWAGLTYIN